MQQNPGIITKIGWNCKKTKIFNLCQTNTSCNEWETSRNEWEGVPFRAMCLLAPLELEYNACKN